LAFIELYHYNFYPLYTFAGMRGVFIILFMSLCCPLVAQLTAGDLMFVGYNADGNDGFSVLALVDIPANSTIYFTDNEWNGSPIGAGGAFNNANEGEITWSTGAATITAGTVINFLETNNAGNAGYGASTGTISGTIDLNAANEVLYAFLGTDDITPTAFLSAIANGGFNTPNGTLTNTGLTAGTNAISITGDEDVMVYSGSTSCNTTVADCAAAIANPANWTTQDGGGDQSADATPPDFPADVPLFFGGSALPVELTRFETSQKGNYVRVYWETATELNNDYFELHRSYDGINFIPLAKIQGSGTTSQTQRYEYIDSDMNLSKYVYYRLKQVDFDGKYEWHGIVLLKKQSYFEKDIRIYPNPVKGSHLYINTNLPVERIEILSLDGKRMRVFTDPGTSLLSMDGLKTGSYLINIITKEERVMRRIQVID